MCHTLSDIGRCGGSDESDPSTVSSSLKGEVSYVRSLWSTSSSAGPMPSRGAMPHSASASSWLYSVMLRFIRRRRRDIRNSQDDDTPEQDHPAARRDESHAMIGSLRGHPAMTERCPVRHFDRLGAVDCGAMA